MDMIAMPFAMMGFIFGLVAFVQASAAAARIEKLEQRLKEAGVTQESDPGG